MQESRYDGSEVLTGRPTPEQIERAIADPRNRAVAIHKPGSSVKFGEDEYIVQFDGTWKRVKSSAEVAAEQRAEDLKRRIREAEGLLGAGLPRPSEGGR